MVSFSLTGKIRPSVIYWKSSAEKCSRNVSNVKGFFNVLWFAEREWISTEDQILPRERRHIRPIMPLFYVKG